MYTGEIRVKQGCAQVCVHSALSSISKVHRYVQTGVSSIGKVCTWMSGYMDAWYWVIVGGHLHDTYDTRYTRVGRARVNSSRFHHTDDRVGEHPYGLCDYWCMHMCTTYAPDALLPYYPCIR